jgi:hypothetical protein
MARLAAQFLFFIKTASFWHKLSKKACSLGGVR